MKKSKLLIPALSVASVGAVVAPMMTLTSCNKVLVSTDDVDFKGTQHAAVTDGWTLAQANEDYLKQPLQHLGDDTMYGLAYLAKTQLAGIKAQETYYKNAKISSFHASLSSVSSSDKSAKVNYQAIANKEAFKGQLVSGVISCKYTISYDWIVSDEYKEIYKSVHQDDTYELNYKLSDCFAFLTLNLIPDGDSYKNGFALNLFGSKDASENWSMINDWKMTETYTWTLKDGSVIVDTDVESEHSTLNTKTQSYDEPINSSLSGLYEIVYFPSTYLSKVNWKNEAMPMGYRDDVYTTDPEKADLAYYANPIMLTPGTEYTFYADIKADDKIQLFQPGSTSTIALVGSKPTIKIDGVDDTTNWTADSGAYARMVSGALAPINKDCRLTVTFTIDATQHTEGPLQMAPLFMHYGA